jgi:hypothetical protein
MTSRFLAPRTLPEVRLWPLALWRSIASPGQLSKVLRTKCSFRRWLIAGADAAAVSGLAANQRLQTKIKEIVARGTIPLRRSPATLRPMPTSG